MVEYFVQQMQSEFEMSIVGKFTYFFGLQMKQMEDNIFISLRKYAKSILKKFGLEKASHKRNPVATHVKLSIGDNGVNVDQSLYRCMIDSLLYLTTSRPDISFSIDFCTRYQANPKASNLIQMKRIMEYINETCDYDILYFHDTSSILVWSLMCMKQD
ncbi:uncharacterized mitochondrial protein AtMg00810-like [Lathyrus oleraceus]|uniref:uncharacterized mitochondrial protein AtMg00810-like n=1 Tax=Pisum sativum TaxID=3888 RepID=UPI0021CE932F|nr:uncharacterized mitochondrial protein AtMg00810-like [Pisum sativum]